MFPGLKSALLTLCALIAPLPSIAHTHLLRSTPAGGTLVRASPPRLQLDFSEPAVVTALSIEKSGDPQRHKLALRPGAPQASFAVALPPLADGSYLVRWRALSADSHVASGSFGFELRNP